MNSLLIYYTQTGKRNLVLHTLVFRRNMDLLNDVAVLHAADTFGSLEVVNYYHTMSSVRPWN
jgi:hypothetical protein